MPFILLIGIGTWIQAQESQLQKDHLHGVIAAVDAYEPYDRKIHPLGLYTDTRFRDEAGFAAAQLQELGEISPDHLSETDRISLELLQFTLKDRIDRYRLKLYLNPIQADQGFHLNLIYRIRPLANYEDVREYLKMMDAIPAFAEQHFELMREGLKQGRSQPRVIFNGYESTYEDHIVEEVSQSPFYGPMENLPPDLTPYQRDSVLNSASSMIPSL